MASPALASAEHLASLPIEPGDDARVGARKIRAMVEHIVSLVHPVRIVAFGSRARGDHDADSDLDVAVVVDRYDPKTDPRPIWRSQIPVLMPIDLIVYDIERERERSSELNSLQWVVAREGRVLFERAKGVVDHAVAESLV